MDIHLPKPFHNWREFLKEYGIIVLGVLTALGLEQAIEWAHHRSEVREATETLRAQSEDDLKIVANNLEALNSSLKEDDSEIAALGGCKSSVAPGKLQPLEYHEVLVPLNTAWQGVRDADLIPLMPKELAGEYSANDWALSIMQAQYEARKSAFDSARAAVETIRGGAGDRAACGQAIFQLNRLKSTELTLQGDLLRHRSMVKSDLQDQSLSASAK
jgi:hypothetical protein